MTEVASLPGVSGRTDLLTWAAPRWTRCCDDDRDELALPRRQAGAATAAVVVAAWLAAAGVLAFHLVRTRDV